MSTYTKANSRRQFRHSDSSSDSHKEDMRQARARRETTFVPIEAAKSEEKKQSLEEMGLRGSERIHRAGRKQPCTVPEEFADYIEHEAKERGWAYCERMKRGKKVTIRRVVESPIEVLTVTAEPALNEYIWSQLRAGHDMSAVTTRVWFRFLELAKHFLVGGRQRYVIGDAIHCDTAHWHGDLVVSRQEDGIRVGDAGLGLCGPWVTAVDRQMRVGAKISPGKRKNFDRSAREYLRRYGAGTRPLDVLLARSLDQAATEVIGEALIPFRHAYAARVPALEAAHAQRTVQALEKAKEKILQEHPNRAEPEVNSPEL